MKTVNDIDHKKAMEILRKTFPSMRRTDSTAIIHSGGKRTVFGCLCGSEHTTSTEWRGRQAKHVQEWKKEHEDCAIKLATKIILGEKFDIYFGK